MHKDGIFKEGSIRYGRSYEPIYLQDFRQLEMDKNSSTKFSETVENILTILGWAMTATYILLKFLNEIQKVYCCFGMIRSPLYNWLKGKNLFVISSLKGFYAPNKNDVRSHH